MTTRYYFDKVPLDAVTMQDVLERIDVAICNSRDASMQIVTANAQFVQIAHGDISFANIIRDADLCVADGVSLVWASRILGWRLPGRVNGTDLMVRVCELAAVRGYGVYLLGGREGAAEGAARRLRQRYPTLRVCGTDCPPIGFDSVRSLDEEVISRITAVKPEILFVGLGAPKQEKWIQRHREICAGVMIGVGGSFELIAGMILRAPKLLQTCGLEWLWRLSMEPRRLFRRYLVGNTLFVLLVVRQYLTGSVDLSRMKVSKK